MDAPTELPAPDKENLLQLAGLAPVYEELDDVTSRRTLRDTVPEQNVGTQLHVPQLIQAGTLTTTSIGAVPVHLPEPLAAYLSTTRVSRHLAGFDWIRGTLKLRFLFRGSATMYGAAYVWWYYGPIHEPFGVPTTPNKQWSVPTSSHCHLIDIASHEELELTIPWRYHEEYREKTDVTPYVSYGIQILNVGSLEAIAPTTFDYEVWAHMEDTEISGYIDAQSKPNGGSSGSNLNFAYKTASGVPWAVAARLAYEGVQQRLFGGATTEPTETTANNRPTTTSKENSQTPVTIQPYGNVASLTPVAELQTLTEVGMSKIPAQEYGCTEFHLLKDLVTIPTLINNVVWSDSSGSSSYTLITMQGYAGWPWEIANHFRYYRGRYRIILDFATSPMIAARYHIRFNKAGSTVLNNDSGVPTYSVEIKGSQRVVIETPWMSQSPVLSVEEAVGTLCVTQVQKPQPLTTGAPARVFMYIHMCYTEDTQFFSLRETPHEAWLYPLPVALEGQAALREMRHLPVDFDIGTGSLQPINYMDPVTTVEEIMSRWSTRYLPDSTGSTVTNVLDNSIDPSDEILPALLPFLNNQWGDNVDKMAPLFTVWRGSRDFRVSGALPEATSLINQIYVTLAPDSLSSPGNGGDIGNGSLLSDSNAIMQFRIPFLNKYMVSPATVTTNPPIPVNSNAQFNNANLNRSVVVSRAGPDFQVFHPNRLYAGSASYMTVASVPTITVIT